LTKRIEAVACHKIGEHKEAIEAIDKALLSKANDSNYLLLKAQILESLGQFNDSFVILNELKQKEKTKEIETAYERVSKALTSEAIRTFIVQDIAHEECILFDNYKKWMKANGAILSKITLKFLGPNYRGIVATSSLDKGEIVLSVPKELIMTLTMAKNTSIGKKITSSGTSLIYPNNSTLATYVLLERNNPHTKWKYMIEAMPKSVSNFPIFFTEEEKSLLKGSQFLRIFYQY